MNNIFNPTLTDLYDLAKQQGDRRFGSECKHERVINGRCAECQRRVTVKRILCTGYVRNGGKVQIKQ